jgi:hypothetical protein
MRAEDEFRQVVLVTDRLTVRHPEVPRPMIEHVVHDVHAGFESSPVREFVPLLVERGAHDILRETKSHVTMRSVG